MITCIRRSYPELIYSVVLPRAGLSSINGPHKLQQYFTETVVPLQFYCIQLIACEHAVLCPEQLKPTQY